MNYPQQPSTAINVHPEPVKESMQPIETNALVYDSAALLVATQVNQYINYVNEWESKVSAARFELTKYKQKLAGYRKAFERVKDI